MSPVARFLMQRVTDPIVNQQALNFLNDMPVFADLGAWGQSSSISMRLHGAWGLFADLLTKEELLRAFPTPETVVGPMYRAGGRLYGRDLTYPLSLSVIAAALHFNRVFYEGRSNTVIRKMWCNVPALAPEVRVSAGITLLRILTCLSCHLRSIFLAVPFLSAHSRRYRCVNVIKFLPLRLTQTHASKELHARIVVMTILKC